VGHQHYFPENVVVVLIGGVPTRSLGSSTKMSLLVMPLRPHCRRLQLAALTHQP